MSQRLAQCTSLAFQITSTGCCAVPLVIEEAGCSRSQVARGGTSGSTPFQLAPALKACFTEKGSTSKPTTRAEGASPDSIAW
eukprot:9033-Heterococcus_DN1.PRE.2